MYHKSQRYLLLGVSLIFCKELVEVLALARALLGHNERRKRGC